MGTMLPRRELQTDRQAPTVSQSPAMPPHDWPAGRGPSPCCRDTAGPGGLGAISPILSLPCVPGRLPADLHGLVLDACNVLYDDTAWRRWLMRILRRLGLHTNAGCFFHVWKRDYLVDVFCGRREFTDALADFLLAAGLSRGQAEEVNIACQSYLHAADSDCRPLIGVRDTLRRLHASGIALGVLCNSQFTAATIAQRLDRLMGEPLFVAVVSSRDLGRAMPEPACYAAAMDAMGLPPEHIAFVGHDREELAGATAAGMPTIGFNCDSGAAPDFVLQRFDDLLQIAAPGLACVAAG